MHGPFVSLRTFVGKIRLKGHPQLDRPFGGMLISRLVPLQLLDLLLLPKQLTLPDCGGRGSLLLVPLLHQDLLDLLLVGIRMFRKQDQALHAVLVRSPPAAAG
jgi:hypothetical protein